MKHPVVHFEIAADDLGRLRGFYADLFGWEMQTAPGMGDYVMVTTKDGETGIDGGMMKKQMPQQTNCNYVQVESVDEYAAKAKELGGQVVVPKMAVPKMGYFAVCLDPEGNPVGLWQTDPEAG